MGNQNVSKVKSDPTIGSHLGKPIYRTIINDGIQYIFDRIAECDFDGCPLQQLNKNEVMLKSGLIYKQF